MDTRRKSAHSRSNTDFIIGLLVRIPSFDNTAFVQHRYSMLVSFFCTPEECCNNSIYLHSGNDKYYCAERQPGNYNTISLNQAIADAMHTSYSKR